MAEAGTAAKQRWTYHWNHLRTEIVDTNICTGCSGCIIVCPHDVLAYDDHWHPILIEEAWYENDSARCVHGEKSCTMCTRACPRFRAWEYEIDDHLWGRHRDVDTQAEVVGVHKSVLLVETTDPEIAEVGQDGGLASTMLAYCLENGIIDAALVSNVDSEWRTTPAVARTREDVLRAAGSRYTYSANILAYDDAVEAGAEKIALVAMGCQASVPPAMTAKGARKVGKRFALTIGLLCSKTFTDDIFEGLLAAEYGVARSEIVKMNIKGKLQVWLRPGANERYPDNYLDVPLKACHAYTRPGCKTCPDFAAEHADISMGGIGKYSGRTLTIVRSDLAASILADMEKAALVRVYDAVDEDPDAVELMRRLAAKSRQRWPVTAETSDEISHRAPGILPG